VSETMFDLRHARNRCELVRRSASPVGILSSEYATALDEIERLRGLVESLRILADGMETARNQAWAERDAALSEAHRRPGVAPGRRDASAGRQA
jgi:hypothetical protein